MTNTLFDGLLGGGDASRAFAVIPGDPTRRYTYGNVQDVTARFAAALIESGLKPGDRVAAQVPKSIEALMLYLATVRAGGVFLPLNTAYTPAEIEYFIGDAEPRIFLCDPKDAAAYREMTGRLGVHLDTFGLWRNETHSAGTFFDRVPDSADFETIPRSPDDLAAILYTSGTTGRSKGAMLSHRNLLSNAETLVEAWRMSGDDVLLHTLPIFHTHGLFVASNPVMLAGGKLIFLGGFNADAVIEHLPSATVMMGVPTFYTRLLAREDFTRDLCANMRLFTSGSAPLLAETHRAFETRTGHRILERYGMTETNMNTSNPYDGERRAGTVGFPLPGVDLRIVGADGAPVPEGEIGTIEVRGDNVCKGYWRMPEKTKEEMRADGFFITGDLGRRDADGVGTKRS
jgi:malonyl-CoA/methylmalonyl-CoA synthetase